MKTAKTMLMFGLVVLFSFATGLHAQQAPARGQEEFPAGGAPANPAAAGNTTVMAQLNQQLSFVEKEFTDAAQAMPEDKYSFAPMKEFPSSNYTGVRNFAQQVLHVAQANYQIYGAIIPDEPRAMAPMPTAPKDQIMQYLRDSFAFAHKAVGTVTPENMLQPVRRAPNPLAGTPLELALFGCSHVSDIYGQVVEYLRMNGLVPPATANQPARGNRGGMPPAGAPGR